MKNRMIPLFLCFLMLLSMLAACQQQPNALLNSPAPAETPEPTSEKDWREEWGERNRLQQENSEKLYTEMLVMQEEMIAFFRAHQEEFESFAFLLHELDASDPDHRYKYNVGNNTLSWFDVDFNPAFNNKAWGEIEDDPILAEGVFLREPQFFLYVQWGYSQWFELDEYCCFGAAVPDELNESYYARLEIIYSKNEPIPDEYQEVTELAPHWYYYYEFLE